MTRHDRNRLILATLIVLAPVAAWAEISAEGQVIVVAAITNGSDPIGTTVWRPLRPLSAGAILNPEGEARLDGPPAMARDPLTGWTFVVWAYNAGTDHDIAISHWDGESWAPVRFLTSGLDDELDPRVFVQDDGMVHVAWWVAGRDEVWTTRRKANTTKWKPARLVGESGARPSIAVHEDTLRIAYEKRLGASSYVAVLRVDDMVTEVLWETSRVGRLDPVLHAVGGRLWVDYKTSDTELGMLQLLSGSSSGDGAPGTETEPGWINGSFVPWPDPTWIGVESSRRAIFRALFADR